MNKICGVNNPRQCLAHTQKATNRNVICNSRSVTLNRSLFKSRQKCGQKMVATETNVGRIYLKNKDKYVHYKNCFRTEGKVVID